MSATLEARPDQPEEKEENVREKRVAAVLSGAPESVKNCLNLAFSGSGGKANAIKAMCLCCTAYDRKAIAGCTGYSCPLWHYRPFQS